eukprot:TRINITY_DN2029_c2_g1_i1.p1 TRINITY_DN2029_c2_g1~~TRINITY_DN2029_c2_g1_i1.p1  ORF type:complete len:111 (+),score=32.84 TRINITY_DN2029_c2_g1_i1:90-422(+)
MSSGQEVTHPSEETKKEMIPTSKPYDKTEQGGVPVSSTSPDARAAAHASPYDKLHPHELLEKLHALNVDTSGLHEKEELVRLLERMEKTGEDLPPPAMGVSGPPAGSLDV